MASFNSKLILYWLCGAFASGLVLIGFFVLAAPQTAAVLFGIPVTAIDALPWVRLAGIRDVALGLSLIAITAMKKGRIAGILILLMMVVPLTDAIMVYTRSGFTCQILLHVSGFVVMAILGILLSRQTP